MAVWKLSITCLVIGNPLSTCDVHRKIEPISPVKYCSDSKRPFKISQPLSNETSLVQASTAQWRVGLLKTAHNILSLLFPCPKRGDVRPDAAKRLRWVTQTVRNCESESKTHWWGTTDRKVVLPFFARLCSTTILATSAAHEVCKMVKLFNTCSRVDAFKAWNMFITNDHRFPRSCNISDREAEKWWHSEEDQFGSSNVAAFDSDKKARPQTCRRKKSQMQKSHQLHRDGDLTALKLFENWALHSEKPGLDHNVNPYSFAGLLFVFFHRMYVWTGIFHIWNQLLTQLNDSQRILDAFSTFVYLSSTRIYL